MTGRPLVTVCMATYNQAGYLRHAVEGLLAQTLQARDVEVVVINDGSTDATAAVLHAFRSTIRLIERENRGLVASCNEGLALARGWYFARVDSDDFVSPNWLECLLDALETSSGACCAYSDRYEVREDQWHYVAAQPQNLYSLEACGTLMRTDILRDVGGYRPFFWEEYDLYLRLRSRGTFVHVPRPLYRYRKHANSMTQSPARRREGWIQLATAWGIETLCAAGDNPDLAEVSRLLAQEERTL